MAILETKILTPSIPAHLVPRQRLLDRLDQSLQRKMTLVSAPAGSGKTTLLSEWIAARRRRSKSAWVSLGREDNDPYRFWNYFVGSINRLADKGFSGWMDLSASPTTDDLDSFINWIALGFRQDFVLVLDDYHFISSAEISDALTYLLDYLPQVMHIVIVSRSVPQLPTAQMRVRNQLLELTRDDLKFTQDEAETLFNQITRKRFPLEEIAQVNERAEGWVAGLQMAAVSVEASERSTLHDLLTTFTGTHRYLGDYFLEQVFCEQTTEIQRFLLSTSIFDRFNKSLCDLVTGEANSQETLERLERNNLFLSRLDERREWYRYHHLFADFLSKKFRAEQPDQYIHLHGMVANWFAERNFFEIAVEYALEAEDFCLADRLIQQVETEMWGRQELRTIQRWFNALPVEFVNSRPDLCLTLAWRAALSGELDEMLSYLDRIEEHCQGEERTPLESNVQTTAQQWRFSSDYFQAHVEILRGYSKAVCGDLDNSLAILRQALQRVPVDDSCRERALALFYLGQTFFWREDLDEAREWFTEAAKVSQNCAHHSIHLASLSYLALIRSLRGNLNQAEDFHKEAIRYVENIGLDVLTSANRTGLAGINIQRNNLEAAEKLLAEGSSLAEKGGGTLDLISASISCAWLQMTTGNLDEAQVHLRKAYQLAARKKLSMQEEIVKAWQARLWLKKKELTAASHWAEHSTTNLATVPYLQEFRKIVHARVLLAEKRMREAIALLDALLESAVDGQRNGIAIEVLILEAVAYDQQGFTSKAVEFIKKALILGEGEGYVRTFVDEGETLIALLKAVIQREKTFTANASMRAYVNLLVGSFHETEAGQKSREGAKKPQPLIEPLSDRELQVLRLISIGKSYEQVAQELVVALSTVQWHIKNIYQKLNVHSGGEATAVARELHIIS